MEDWARKNGFSALAVRHLNIAVMSLLATWTVALALEVSSLQSEKTEIMERKANERVEDLKRLGEFQGRVIDLERQAADARERQAEEIIRLKQQIEILQKRKK